MIDIQSKKLDQQFIKLFEIIERIERLTYYFKLSLIIKIHNVVSVIHLKSASILDSYKR